MIGHKLRNEETNWFNMTKRNYFELIKVISWPWIVTSFQNLRHWDTCNSYDLVIFLSKTLSNWESNLEFWWRFQNRKFKIRFFKRHHILNAKIADRRFMTPTTLHESSILHYLTVRYGSSTHRPFGNVSNFS